MKNIKVMLDEGAKITTAHEWDAGFDLYAREDATIFRHGSYTFDTGVHAAIENGWVGFLKSKSGLMVSQNVLSEGVIDSGYTGSIRVKLFNHGSSMVHIKKGQKISQLVLLPIAKPEIEFVDSLEETERGTGGFGSSGAF